MQVFVEDVMYVSQDKLPMSGGDSEYQCEYVYGAWAYLKVSSTIRNLSLSIVKLLCKYNNPKGRQ